MFIIDVHTCVVLCMMYIHETMKNKVEMINVFLFFPFFALSFGNNCIYIRDLHSRLRYSTFVFGMYVQKETFRSKYQVCALPVCSIYPICATTVRFGRFYFGSIFVVS